jgi:hypothetical protein
VTRRSRAHLGGIALAALVTIAGAGCADGDATANPTDPPAANDATLTGVVFDVHRDPGCGCCTSWVEYLRTHGATVDVTDDPERPAYRTELGIDDEVASCHTAEVDGYVIEGHVPAEAIQRLRTERPDAIGLALPGMPADSPGMGGDTKDWADQPVVLVEADGSLSEWDW